MKAINRVILIVVIFLTNAVVSYAQGPGFDPDVEPYAAPVDGGLWLLGLVGLIYGIKRYMDIKADKSKVISQ